MKIEYLNEIWKDIKGYEGIYQVSNFGRIRNIVTGKPIKLIRLKNGYFQVNLCVNGKPKPFYVHRLVAIAFIPNPNNYKYVNHKDENPANNCASNLEWCTHKYNCNYGTRNKRLSENHSGIFNTNKSKPILQYDLEGKFIKEWPSAKEVERQLGFASTNIAKCLKGKYKQAYGYIWKYKD